MDDHQFTDEENESVEELSTVCSQIVLKMSVFDSYWETWYFVVCEQTCSWGHKVENILCQTLGAFDLTHSSYKWIPVILLCGKHGTPMQIRIVSRPWFCRRPWRLKINIKKNSLHFRKPNLCANKLDVQETDFSLTHSSTEAELISLDAGLRMDGIPALDLWDLAIEIFHSVPNRTNGCKREPWGNPSAVVKPVIIKNRSPTMRHVSRTHRVALDGLFDMINLDRKIQIRHIDTKHQLASRHFDQKEFHTWWAEQSSTLFQYQPFQLHWRTKNFSLMSSSTVAKRIQDQKEEEESAVSKSRPAAMNLSCFIATRSSTTSSPIVS